MGFWRKSEIIYSSSSVIIADKFDSIGVKTVNFSLVSILTFMYLRVCCKIGEISEVCAFGVRL